MATNNKQAGKDRPYTFHEFLRIIEQIAKQQKVECIDELDYFLANTPYDLTRRKDDPLYMDDWDCQIYSETRWGGSEGIYTNFYVRKYNEEKNTWERIDFATAKNLGESHDDFIRMHIMAAKVSLIARKYMHDHKDAFEWTGWNTGDEQDGKITWHWLCGSEESAMKHAREMKADNKGLRIVVRNNATRKVVYL